jgi:hypothetical protein
MKRIFSALVLAVLCLTALPFPARADIAPPQQPPGSNPAPGSEITQVRMEAETVTIDVLAGDPPRAHVSAIFTMRNLGGSTETLAVRFPIAASDGSFGYPEIKNVGIQVNDRKTPFRRVQGPEPNFGLDQDVPWAEFDIGFAPGQDVQVGVSYDLDGTSYPEDASTSFYYILSTGAGWKGTIGSAEIVLRLPYNANPQNVILEDDVQNAPKFVGREAYWKFTELEPTVGNNLTFKIVKPAIWKQVVTELDNVSRNPQDGEAYGRLGKAYKQALFDTAKGFPRTDSGAGGLYQASRDAYDKAVTLKPKDGLWHAGYAELLLDYYYWTHIPDQLYTDDLNLGLNELNLACLLAPKDSKVLDLIDRYSSDFPDYIVKKTDGSLVFLSLTQTPKPAPEIAVTTAAPLPTLTVPPAYQSATAATLPTLTVPPAYQPTTAAPATPAPKPSFPICGGAALILLPVALIAQQTRKSRSGKI